MSPRTKEQNEEIRKQRTQDILQAAILVYAEKGYAGSDIADIAERAGLARSLVYHYFKDKQALFGELYIYMMDRTDRFTKAHFSQEGSAFELLNQYARLVCRQVLEEPAVSRFYTRVSLDVHHMHTAEQASPFQWVISFLQPLAQVIEKGIHEGTVRSGDANLLAVQFWGAVSQGMNYLDQLQQELVSQGIQEEERVEQLKAALEQMVESAIAVIKP